MTSHCCCSFVNIGPSLRHHLSPSLCAPSLMFCILLYIFVSSFYWSCSPRRPWFQQLVSKCMCNSVVGCLNLHPLCCLNQIVHDPRRIFEYCYASWSITIITFCRHDMIRNSFVIFRETANQETLVWALHCVLLFLTKIESLKTPQSDILRASYDIFRTFYRKNHQLGCLSIKL